jgi:hypothetical protein
MEEKNDLAERISAAIYRGELPVLKKILSEEADTSESITEADWIEAMKEIEERKA